MTLYLERQNQPENKQSTTTKPTSSPDNWRVFQEETGAGKKETWGDTIKNFLKGQEH